MKLKETEIKPIPHKEAKDFCKKWHYSKSCPGCKFYFGLYYKENIIGIIAFGEPAMRFQKKCYNVDLELRRLCLIDDTPKNAESFFIGNTLKIIKSYGFNNILSLADPNFGHTGVIYKASNFEYVGVEQGGGSRDIFIDGKHYHSRTAFAKFGASGYKKLKQLFPNKTIEVRNKERKHVYIYNLNRGKRQRN